MNPTAADLRALQVLADADKPMECAELGDRLWGNVRRYPQGASALTCSAGKVIKRLVKANWADGRRPMFRESGRPEYIITPEGTKVLRRASKATNHNPTESQSAQRRSDA